MRDISFLRLSNACEWRIYFRSWSLVKVSWEGFWHKTSPLYFNPDRCNTVRSETKSFCLKPFPGYFYWQVLCPAGTRLKLFLLVWKELDGARRDHHQKITRSPHFHSLENFNINIKLCYTPFLKFLPITLRRPGWKLFLKKKISIFDNVLEKIKSKIFEIK